MFISLPIKGHDIKKYESDINFPLKWIGFIMCARTRSHLLCLQCSTSPVNILTSIDGAEIWCRTPVTQQRRLWEWRPLWDWVGARCQDQTDRTDWNGWSACLEQSLSALDSVSLQNGDLSTKHHSHNNSPYNKMMINIKLILQLLFSYTRPALTYRLFYPFYNLYKQHKISKVCWIFPQMTSHGILSVCPQLSLKSDVEGANTGQ